MITTTPAGQASIILDWALLRRLSNERFGKSVDCDMRGTPITDCDVLLSGAYGPFVRRLLTLVALQPKGPMVGRKLLHKLAPIAFGQAVDKDFGGNVMTSYAVVLEESYGFGPVTLKMARLAHECVVEMAEPA